MNSIFIQGNKKQQADVTISSSKVKVNQDEITIVREDIIEEDGLIYSCILSVYAYEQNQSFYFIRKPIFFVKDESNYLIVQYRQSQPSLAPGVADNLVFIGEEKNVVGISEIFTSHKADISVELSSGFVPVYGMACAVANRNTVSLYLYDLMNRVEVDGVARRIDIPWNIKKIANAYDSILVLTEDNKVIGILGQIANNHFISSKKIKIGEGIYVLEEFNTEIMEIFGYMNIENGQLTITSVAIDKDGALYISGKKVLDTIKKRNYACMVVKQEDNRYTVLQDRNVVISIDTNGYPHIIKVNGNKVNDTRVSQVLEVIDVPKHYSSLVGIFVIVNDGVAYIDNKGEVTKESIYSMDIVNTTNERMVVNGILYSYTRDYSKKYETTPVLSYTTSGVYRLLRTRESPASKPIAVVRCDYDRIIEVMSKYPYGRAPVIDIPRFHVYTHRGEKTTGVIVGSMTIP